MVGNGGYLVSGTNATVGWYEITAVSAGVSITVDRNCTTGVGASIVFNVGGAMSLNSTLDDSLFEAFVGGNTVYVKSGTFTLGQSISVASASSTSANPVVMRGYGSTRGDNPRGSTRPVFTCAANTMVFGQFWQVYGCQFTITTAGGVTFGTSCSMFYCYCLNTSTTAARAAISPTSDSCITGCEIISQNGTGLTTALGLNVSGCYIHDCATGILTGASTGRFSITNCIIESCRDFGIDIALTSTGAVIESNTIYGAEAKSPGTGVRIGASAANIRFFNNIIYGWTTGLSQTTAALKSNVGAYNCFNNNTTNTTNYTLDATDITTNPSFTGASQLTGTTANTSGSVLTQSGGDFSSVTDNIDFLRVVSGTGVTTGLYLITAHTSTTVTTNNALGTSSSNNDVWVIPVGHNLAVGTNMKAAGYPGAFSSNASETTGYLDLGAVQRQETSSTSLSRARFQRKM
jgi:hypothetical protein